MDTVKPHYLELDGTVFKKLWDIQVIKISRVKCLKYKWLELTNHCDISTVFETFISVRNAEVQLYTVQDKI